MTSAPLRMVRTLTQSASPKNSFLLALEQIRRMRGGTQAHLMRCSDGYYVVKFPDNPQGTRILANEFLGGRLAELLGLPVAERRVIFVPEELIRLTRDLVFEHPSGVTRCSAGLCFGSRYQGDPRNSLDTTNILPRNLANQSDFLGMLVFDKWTCNTDGRQVVYRRIKTRSGLYDEQPQHKAVMIDQGFCFNAEEWNFPDAPLRGRFYRTSVYDKVTGISSFEPWLTKLETEINAESLSHGAEGIPEAWCGSMEGLRTLLERLNRRRMKVRELLIEMSKATPITFPNWYTGSRITRPLQETVCSHEPPYRF